MCIHCLHHIHPPTPFSTIFPPPPPEVGTCSSDLLKRMYEQCISHFF
jgi:hypothetical protein